MVTYDIPTHVHIKDFASPDEQKSRLWLCGDVVLCELRWACKGQGVVRL